MEETVTPAWRVPPKHGVVVPSRAMRPHVAVYDGWQVVCSACAEMPWTVGPWRSQWIDAMIDAWAHNSVRHSEPVAADPTWEQLLTGDTPEPEPLVADRPTLGQHCMTSR
jgi:hypothetical protein